MSGAEFGYQCRDCARSLALDQPVFRCGCGGLLDLAPFPVDLTAAARLEERSLFRYAAALPFRAGTAPWREVSMGEWLTPLVPLDPRRPEVLVKLDYAMPTLSFKDRGAAVLVTQAKAMGVRRIVQDSSGNAGASVAAYAARAGIGCEIYVPEATSARKIAQIAACGAAVKVVPGSREDTAAAALEAAGRPGAFYASHVYNPLFHQGVKTYVFELFEALGRMPETLFVPVGNGTLLLGVQLGLRDLGALGHIHRFPRVVAVQAEGCAPIHQAWTRGKVVVEPVPNEGTAAEGIAIAAPARGAQILAAIRELGGEVVVAPEAGIGPAKEALAARGFFVETTTAATYSAFLAAGGAAAFPGTVVLPLCGAGLKSL